MKLHARSGEELRQSVRSGLMGTATQIISATKNRLTVRRDSSAEARWGKAALLRVIETAPFPPPILHHSFNLTRARLFVYSAPCYRVSPKHAGGLPTCGAANTAQGTHHSGTLSRPLVVTSRQPRTKALFLLSTPDSASRVGRACTRHSSTG